MIQTLIMYVLFEYCFNLKETFACAKFDGVIDRQSQTPWFMFLKNIYTI